MIEDHLYQHVDTDSFPTQRTSDLARTPSAWWSASISCRRRASSGICSAAASISAICCGDRSPSTYELSSQPSIGVDIVPSYKPKPGHLRSEEHTSELKSLMLTSYPVFCLKKKNTQLQH